MLTAENQHLRISFNDQEDALKKFCAESLPGPVELLWSISDGDVSVEYVKVKYK